MDSLLWGAEKMHQVLSENQLNIPNRIFHNYLQDLSPSKLVMNLTNNSRKTVFFCLMGQKTSCTPNALIKRQ